MIETYRNLSNDIREEVNERGWATREIGIDPSELNEAKRMVGAFLGTSPKPLEDAIGVALANYNRNGGVSTAINQQKQRISTQKNQYQ